MNKYLFPVLLSALLALAGCGEKKTAETVQAAVKVGGDAVTVAALDREMKKLGELSETQTQQAKEKVLNALVDQTLLMQAAVSAKLDAQPEVKQRLESARRQVLAETYIEHLASTAAKPSDADINAYYNQHPELFAERQIYKLQELNIQVSEANVQTIQAQLTKSKNLNDFVAWLKGQNIPVQGRLLAKPAEQLPTPLLEKLSKAKAGEGITSIGIDKLNLIILVGVEKQSVTLEQAKPAIERYLENSKKKELVQQELKTRRETANIEYLPPYASMAKQEAGQAEGAEKVEKTQSSENGASAGNSDKAEKSN